MVGDSAPAYSTPPVAANVAVQGRRRPQRSRASVPNSRAGGRTGRRRCRLPGAAGGAAGGAQGTRGDGHAGCRVVRARICWTSAATPKGLGR